MKKGFKPVKGYEGIYYISEHGKVINKIGKELKGSYIQNTGYKIYELSKNGKSKRYLVHRLVANNFLPNPSNKPCVHHKNHNRSDNRVSNLEWVTQKENNQYYLEFKKEAS